MMTRKDYIALSNKLNYYVHNYNCCDKFVAGFDELVQAIIEDLEKDNPNFDGDKFWDACFDERK
jgi:hypothetical protein